MHEFKFTLLQTVSIIASKETGVVIARCQHSNAEDSYLVRYKAGDGRAVESWWTETALQAY